MKISLMTLIVTDSAGQKLSYVIMRMKRGYAAKSLSKNYLLSVGMITAFAKALAKPSWRSWRC
jgi:hypothetical protein